jgi:hypothetical protein
MIVHQREIGYGENYPEFFDALVKAKDYQDVMISESCNEGSYRICG